MDVEDCKPTIVMVGCQIIYAGVTLSSRQVLLQDLDSRVFVLYRQSIAFLLLAPLAFFSRRGTKGCGLSWKSFWLIFLLSFIGVTINQNLYTQGLYLSSSSAASALSNLIPAITFLLAYTLGLEKVNVGSLRSMAKVFGTVMCVGGAAVMALMKGPKLLNMEFQPKNSIFLQSFGDQDTWVLGCFFVCGSTFCWSLWLILQVHVTGCYPDHLSLTAWMCLIATFQSGILTFILSPDINMNAWILTSPFQLICCFYAGLASAVTFIAQAWCISKRGPLFSAMFNPLCTVIVTVFACVFMHEDFFIGSLMGGVAVIIGLYIVLWGKAQDDKEVMEQDTTQFNKTTINYDHLSDCRIHLEDPLLPENSSDIREI